jgi:PAS domain S-box-containing protein
MASIHDSPEMLQALLDMTPTPIFVKDREGRLLLVNRAVEDQLGAPRDRLLGHVTSDFTTTAAYATTEELDRAVLETGRPIAAEQETLVGGELRSYHVTKFPLVDAGGRTIAVGAIASDVTEERRTQLEARLLQAAHMFDILDCVRDGIVVLNRDWTYAYLNTQAAAMVGRERNSLLGKHIWTEFPEGVGQPFHRNYERAMATGESFGFVDYYEPWDRWFENRLHPSEHGLAIFFQDVTEQRSGALQREQLLVNLVNAQESERTRIAADLHDDAVQALSASLLRLDLLELRLDASDRAEALRDAREAVQRSIAALRAAVFDLRPPTQAGLGPALSDYLDQCRERHGLRAHLDCELDTELTDERRTVLYRIATEAIKNAAKHAGARHVSVSVDDSHGGVSLRVADDGKGFDVAGHRPEPGHIGLESMRERAELAGGTLKIESGPQSGTVVTAWIPMAPEGDIGV